MMQPDIENIKILVNPNEKSAKCLNLGPRGQCFVV